MVGHLLGACLHSNVVIAMGGKMKINLYAAGGTVIDLLIICAVVVGAALLLLELIR